MSQTEVNSSSSDGTEVGNGYIWVGSIVIDDDGEMADNRRLASFKGTEMAKRIASSAEGVVGGTNGTCETIYSIGDDKYVLHTENWNLKPGVKELFSYSIRELDKQEGETLIEEMQTGGSTVGNGKIVPLDKVLEAA